MERPENDLAEIHGKPLFDLHLTLWDVFSKTAETYPDREALVSLWQPVEPDSSQELSPTEPSGCLRWTYHDLLDRVEGLAELLRGLGCGPGMQLAAVLWNSAEWGLFFWASARIGMAFVPIDPRVPDDVRSMLPSLRPQIVVVQDAELAAVADIKSGGIPIRVQCSGTALDGWTSLRGLSQLKRAHAGASTRVLQEAEDYDRNVALVVFTSGTTGNPKGCPHTDQNLISQTCDYDPNTDKSIIDRWLVHTPVSHIFAVNNALRAWRCGDAVVFASKSFDIGSTLKALSQEGCTIMSATPTLVKGLLAHQEFPDLKELTLELVTIGGTSISAGDIDLCRQGLGAKNAIQAYGMSEGAPLISWSRTDPQLVNGYHQGVGKVLPGAAARICNPGTQEVISRGETGEIHLSGSSIISRYLDDVDATSFYNEGSIRWFRTGDQAMVDEEGVIHILGRYKDIIIRGGENIYPAKVETALAVISNLQAHVVGVPDAVAGQVPVAVVRLPPDLSKEQVIQRIRQLNLRHALDGIYTLEELGFERVPVTSIGKVKKELLKQAIMQYRGIDDPTVQMTNVQHLSHTSTPVALVDKLVNIWEMLTGARPQKDDSLVHFADSIMLLRYCDSVVRLCGQRLYLQDLVENNTLEKQAKLLDTRGRHDASFVETDHAGKATGNDAQKNVPVWSPDPIEQHFGQNSDSDGESETWKGARERLQALGLQSKLEGVSRIRASLHRAVVGLREHSYHVRVVFRVSNAKAGQVRRGLEQGLRSRPMMRTVLYQGRSGEPHHAIVEADERLFDQLILETDVESEDEAAQRFQDDSPGFHSSPFMFRAEIVRTRDTNQLHLSVTYNHSIVDALALLSWHSDLGRLIGDSNSAIPARTPYSMFADLFTQYEDSMPAQNSVSFHVGRLRGISRFERALWPRQRAPGWMISNDESSVHAEERSRIRTEVWKEEWETRASEFRYPRLGRVVCLPGLRKLREEQGVSPAVFAKCALIIFNVLRTGSSHAVFSTWESGRSWPFVPRWMEPMLPPAMGIDGPTAQWVLGMFEVIGKESIISFLQRQMEEHEKMKNHEHAPWQKVVEGLRDEGHVAVDASFRQSFVWDVSLGLMASQRSRSEMETLEPIARYDWADCGLFWNAFMVDNNNLYFIASWDTAQMNDTEIEEHCDSLADVMRKLADERRWGKKVEEVFGL